MNELTTENYKEILDKHFSLGETVLVGITPSQNCATCRANHATASNFLAKNENIKIYFYSVDYGNHKVFQDNPELEKMTYFPKIVVFHGSWDSQKFHQGEFTEEQFATLIS